MNGTIGARAAARETLVNRNGEKIGKLPDVYVDIETDGLEFAAVKEDITSRHLTFVPLHWGWGRSR